jgi:hypothetical protein
MCNLREQIVGFDIGCQLDELSGLVGITTTLTFGILSIN